MTQWQHPSGCKEPRTSNHQQGGKAIEGMHESPAPCDQRPDASNPFLNIVSDW